MPAQTARRTHARTAAARSAAPRHARRLSGPTHALRGNARTAATAGAVAGGRAVPRSRQRTSTFERLSRVADHRLVDGLLRSRAWIVVVGVLLGGIVAMQVSLLKLNSGISRAVEASATLERENADMQDRIARLSSGQRVSTAAMRAGMVFPPAGEVTYLNARPARDSALASRRMAPPSAAATALMAAGGHGSAPSTSAAATTPTGASGTVTATTSAATTSSGTATAPTGATTTSTAPAAPATTANTTPAAPATTATTTPVAPATAATATTTTASGGG